MDVCYPFRENFDQYSKPEGTWAGFEEAIQEAQEYERTGQFIVLTSGQEKAQEEEESSSEESDAPPRRRRKVAKRKRPAHSSDDDANFDDDSEDGASSKKKGVAKRLKRGGTTGAAKPVKTIRANREQKLFAREIFKFIKEIEKAIKEKSLDEALSLLKKFDPKTVTKRVNKDGLTVDAPGPYAQIETQVVHISRLGRFVHGLAKEHQNDVLGPYAQMLYRHLRSNARRELAIPDDVEAYLANQEHKATKTSSSSSSSSAPLTAAPPSTSNMDTSTATDTPSHQKHSGDSKPRQNSNDTAKSTQSSGTEASSAHPENGHHAASAMDLATGEAAPISLKLEHSNNALLEPMHVDS